MISKSQRSERMSSLINQKYVDVFRSSAHVGIKRILMHNNGKWKVRNRRVFPCFAAQLLRTGDYSIVSVTEIVSQCLMKRNRQIKAFKLKKKQFPDICIQCKSTTVDNERALKKRVTWCHFCSRNIPHTAGNPRASNYSNHGLKEQINKNSFQQLFNLFQTKNYPFTQLHLQQTFMLMKTDT